jgi:hypothetical protein
LPLQKAATAKSLPIEHSKVSVEPIKGKKKKEKEKKISNESTAMVYKVQLEAQPHVDVNDARYDIAREGGEVEKEFIEEKNLYRVLVGSFPSKKEANAFAAKMRDTGAFPQAFISKYPK